MNLTEKIACFIDEFTYSDIPDAALPHIKRSILDYTGVALAGISEESSRLMRRFVDSMGGEPQATIWGTQGKTSVIYAAMANGAAAHTLDYDDIDHVIMGHPSIQLLPGLFALSEYHNKSGSEVILAYLMGFEIGVKLGKALNPNHINQGWLPIGTIGTLMQAAASAKLLGLNRDQIIMALGMATNLASGLRCNNGSMAKHLLAGHVSANGITAAMLAGEGFTSNPQAIETRFGFFENFSRGDISSLEKAINTLGDELEIIQSGICHKLYPVCAATHPAIDCALHLMENHTLDLGEIEEIKVVLNLNARLILIYPRPETPAQAKHSLEYCVARAFLDSKIGLEQLHPSKIQEPAVLSLIEKIRPDYREPAGENKNRQPAELHLLMKDGTGYSHQVNAARGTPENPLSDKLIEEKFQQCCAGVLQEASIVKLKHFLKDLEGIHDMARLVSILSQI